MGDWSDYTDNENGEEFSDDPEFTDDDSQSKNENKPKDYTKDKKDDKVMDYFQNLISSNSTTKKIYAKEITEKEISVVKDSIGAHILVIHDDKAFDKLEQLSEKIVQNDDGSSFCIIFINELMTVRVEEEGDVKLDYQNILEKKDIENEASKILAG